jgi:hypothetical protein
MPINAGGVGISFGRHMIDERAPEWEKARQPRRHEDYMKQLDPQDF